jgi:homoserine kinase
VIARRAGTGIAIAEVLAPDGAPHAVLSADSRKNTASIAARALWDAHGDGTGVELRIRKGVPLQSGMGSSAASAVAGAVAVNALLDEPLPHERLLPYALEGERFASGGLHADNVAPSLLGGMVLCPPALLPRTIPLKTPAGVSAVLLHPELAVNTAEARKRLAPRVAREDWIAQQGYLAAFIVACASGDVELIRESLKDVIIEPQRADSVPCFPDVRDAAVESGALGCSLSGSGPSIFALVQTGNAAAVSAAMQQACSARGIECQAWTSPMTASGARVEA